jgi:cell division transport system permease protein
MQGFRNFFRNAWLSIAATAIMVVTLTVILASVIVNRALGDTIADIASNITVSVYLKDQASQAKLDVFETALRQSYNVEAVDFISKEEALAIFQEQNKDDPQLISGIAVTDNVLPASFEITVKDLGQIDAVTAVANQEGFQDVVDETSVSEERRKSIDNIAKAQDFITISSIVVAGIFAAISVLVIFNTIRMAVFTRQQEIHIMKLIGATPWYIRGPFLFEAALYGVFAGILSFVAVYSALLSLGPRTNQQILIEPVTDLFIDHALLVLVVTISAGILVGLVSSYVSMSKHLRLKHW